LLNYHLLAAHGDNSAVKKLSCTECNFTSVYPSYFKKHSDKHSEDQLEKGKLKIKSLEIEKLST